MFEVRHETTVHESAEVEGALGRGGKTLEQPGVEAGMVPRSDYVFPVEAEMVQVDAAAQDLADRSFDSAVGNEDRNTMDEGSDTRGGCQLRVQAGDVLGKRDERGVHERETESPEGLASVGERSDIRGSTTVAYGLHNVRIFRVGAIAVVLLLLVIDSSEVNNPM